MIFIQFIHETTTLFPFTMRQLAHANNILPKFVMFFFLVLLDKQIENAVSFIKSALSVKYEC